MDTPARPATNGPPTRHWLVRTLRWHVFAMLALNLVLTGTNIVTGGWWWAFWPLAVTAALLAVHYFFYKAAAADERWVTERVEELNLKSYDRSHIEDLKSRYGDEGTDERKEAPRGAP